jgi:hypothetical protein
MRQSGWFKMMVVALCACLMPACTLLGPGNDPSTQRNSREDHSKQQKTPADQADRADPRSMAQLPIDVQPPEGQRPLVPARPPEPLPLVNIAETPPPVVQAIPVKKVEPPAPEPDVVLALRRLIEQNPDEAQKLLQRYDSPNRESLWRLLNMADRFHEKGLEKMSAEEICTIQESLRNLERAVRARAPLHIGQMFFFESASASGESHPLGRGHLFRAGNGAQPGELVQVHVEVHNLICEKKGELYETRLAWSAEIHDPNDKRGKAIWQGNLDNGREIVRRPMPRTDYAINYSFYMPALPTGTLLLTITVQDLTHPDQPRIARRSLEFCVKNHSERVALTP